jgi:hypothetical protein
LATRLVNLGLYAEFSLHTPEFSQCSEERTHSADHGMVGALFDIVNAAPKVARDLEYSTPDR